MLTAFFVTLLTASLFALFWPPVWRSMGVILIEQQEIPTEYVRAAVTSYADQRVQVINQRVMTSGNLLSIINKFNLYADERQRKPREVVLEKMRDDIRIDMISADVVDPRQGRPTKATIAFSVSYDADTPERAAGVANELTSLYLRENLESRQRLAAQSASFLDEEAARIGERVAAMSERVAGFKAQHGEALPEYSQINMQQMNRIDDDLRDIDARRTALDQQLTYLDAQLAQIDPDAQMYSDGGQRVLTASDRLKMLRTQSTTAKAIYGPTHPDVVRLQREIQGLESQVTSVDNSADVRRQLTDARTRLAAAEERYAANHPDVQRLRALVAALEQEVANSPARSPAATTTTPDNPIYIQMKAQREAVVNDRDALELRKASLQARARELERRFARTPGIERDYSTLLRDLQGEQLKYAEVRQKQMEAQLASNLESESKGERFSLIEPPIEPQKPYSPNRLLIMLLGLVLAIGISIGTMLAFETLDTRVRGRADIISLLEVPPLAILPWVATASELQSRRRTWQLAAASSVVGLVAVALAVHFFYRPLDLLWLTALRRIG